MSGHSKWHSIKHKKAREDAKRGKIFTRLIKEVTIAARLGGGDPDHNPRLRLAMDRAKAQNMPASNIDRAIKKGTGELPGQVYEEVLYEGYGPGGAALLIEVVTDNRNRTVSEIRHLLAKHNGHLGETGSVAWMFDKKGCLRVPEAEAKEDELLDIIVEQGAEDMSRQEGHFEIITEVTNFHAVGQALEDNGVPVASSELVWIPRTSVPVTGKKAQQLLHLLEMLEDHDDVQNIHANFDIDEAELEGLV